MGKALCYNRDNNNKKSKCQYSYYLNSLSNNNIYINNNISGQGFARNLAQSPRREPALCGETDILSPLVAFALRQGCQLISTVNKQTGEIIEYPVSSDGLVNRRINDRNNKTLEAKSDFFTAEIKLLKQDILIKRKNKCFSPAGGGLRSSIMKFSRASQRRLKLAVRNSDVEFKNMLTLTYPGEFPTDGRKVKRDLSVMRKWLVRRGVSGIAILEFQSRGAPHFHLLYNDIQLDKSEVSKQWYEVVGSGDIRHLRAGTRIEPLRQAHAAQRYVYKFCETYMSKFDQKGVPEEYKEVGRFWSRFGKLKIEAKIVAAGSLSSVKNIIRLVRHAYEKKRSTYNHNRKFRDNGRFSFTCWGMAEKLRNTLINPLRLEVLKL